VTAPRSCTFIIACVVIVELTGVGLVQPTAFAQDATDVRDKLVAANEAAKVGDWQLVIDLVSPLAAMTDRPSGERGNAVEVYRLLGLALFFSNRMPQAEQAMLAYLRLDVDARLDPALVAPEAVTFLERVRFNHAGELRALRPKPKRTWALNLLPPLGQLQNGQRSKAIGFSALMIGFASINVSSYLLLRSWCSSAARVCESNGADRRSEARIAKVVNYVSGGGLVATYAWGVFDAIRVNNRQKQSWMATILPSDNGGIFVLGGQF
jgi:hypothetical protein